MTNPSIWTPGQAVSAESSNRVQTFIAAAGQTNFTITNFTYEVGTNSLEVDVSGVNQRPGIDFIETGSNSFSLTSPIEEVGTSVFVRGLVDVHGNPQVISDASNVSYLTETVKMALDARLPELANYAALNSYVGPLLPGVYVRGVVNVFDGGHGVFRPTSDTPVAANGIYRQDGLGRWWKREFSGEIFAKWFGGFSVAPASDANFKSALNASVALGVPLTFRGIDSAVFSVGVDVSGDFEIDFADCDILISGNVSLIRAVAPVKDKVLLSSDYVTGASSISVSTLSSAPVAGTPVKVISNAVDPANRWIAHTSDRQYRAAEWAVTAPGSTTTTINIVAPLAFTEGQQPGVSAATRVPAYTTALSATAIILERVTCSIYGGVIQYEDGHAGDGWNAKALSISGYYNPRINVRITRGYAEGVALLGTQYAQVTGSVSNLENNPSLDQYGYGVSDAGYCSHIYSMCFSNVRHGVTTNAITAKLDDGVGRLISTGRTQNTLVTDCVGHGGTNAHFDTHQCAEGATFVNCRSIGSGSYGFAARGRKVKHISPVADRCAGGFYALTEFSGGDMLWGETLADVTSVEIVSPQFSTTGNGILGSSCVLDVSGHAVIRCHTDKIIECGGILRLNGSAKVTCETVVPGVALSSTGDGLIMIKGVSAKVSAAFGGIGNCSVASSADWNIDATALPATKGVVTLTSVQNAMRLDGRIKLNLSAGSTLVEGAGITSGPGGRIEYAATGADNAITIGAINNLTKIVADDGSAYVDSVRLPSAPAKPIYSSVNVGVSHAGTGSENTNIYKPKGQRLINMLSDGDTMEFNVAGNITSGGGTITVRSNGAFNDSIAIPSSTDSIYWALNLKALKLSGDNWLFVFRWSYQTSATTGASSGRLQHRPRTFSAAGLSSNELVRFGATLASGQTLNILACDVSGSVGGFW